MDPVNGLCHYFLTLNKWTVGRSLCYLVITLCVTSIVAYLQRISGNGIIRNFEWQEPLQGNIEEGGRNKATAAFGRAFRSIFCPNSVENFVWKWMQKIRQNFDLLFATWAFLLVLRLLSGQMLIGQEQEGEAIMKSIK